MTDEEIIAKCDEYMILQRSMSVTWYLTKILNIQDVARIRRIRNRLLEKNIYAESSQKDREGDLRIVFNANYKEPTEREIELAELGYEKLKYDVEMQKEFIKPTKRQEYLLGLVLSLDQFY